MSSFDLLANPTEELAEAIEQTAEELIEQAAQSEPTKKKVEVAKKKKAKSGSKVEVAKGEKAKKKQEEGADAQAAEAKKTKKKANRRPEDTYVYTLRRAPRRRAVQVALGLQGLSRYVPVDEAVDALHREAEKTLDLLWYTAVDNAHRERRRTVMPRDLLAAIKIHGGYRHPELVPRLVELLMEDKTVLRIVKDKAPNVLSNTV